MLASARYESAMQRDIVHMSGPNQQRIGGVGGALVAMAAAFHHQAQVIIARKVYRCRDVMSIACGNCVNAWFGSPCIDPSQGLCESRLIADIIWIFQVLPQPLGGGTRRISFGYRQRKVYRNQISPGGLIEPMPRRH